MDNIVITRMTEEDICEIAELDKLCFKVSWSEKSFRDEMQNKLAVYFTAKKEHIVGGTAYYVSTRYNREQGIGQLEKMLALCEGNSEAFQIKAVPDKSVKSAKGKKGIEELI